MRRNVLLHAWLGWTLIWSRVVASSLHSCLFAVRCRGTAATMATCPKGLAGTEWLVAQGARHELPRARSGMVNPELSSSLQYLAVRTEQEIKEDDAAVWQMAYAEQRRTTLQAAAVDPARMVQFVAGRPCVVPG